MAEVTADCARLEPTEMEGLLSEVRSLPALEKAKVGAILGSLVADAACKYKPLKSVWIAKYVSCTTTPYKHNKVGWGENPPQVY